MHLPTSLRVRLREDPGFRAWCHNLLLTFWLAVSALALMFGWLTARVFAAVVAVFAAILVIQLLRTRGRGQGHRSK